MICQPLRARGKGEKEEAGSGWGGRRGGAWINMEGLEESHMGLQLTILSHEWHQLESLRVGLLGRCGKGRCEPAPQR